MRQAVAQACLRSASSTHTISVKCFPGGCHGSLQTQEGTQQLETNVHLLAQLTEVSSIKVPLEKWDQEPCQDLSGPTNSC